MNATFYSFFKLKEFFSQRKVWFSLGAIMLIIFCFLFLPKEAAEEVIVENNTIEITGPVLPVAQPVRLKVPKIKIDAAFTTPLGLDENNEVSVPEGYDEVGLYKYGPTPGSVGPAVILGHVDSYTGPAVFYALGQLLPGDDIFIKRDDGSVAHFQVTHFERYEQDDFPTRKIYGDIDHAGLRLITCTGRFNKGEQRYSQNLVVYARLIE